MGRTQVNGEELLERLKWRYAVKQYDRERKITDEDIAILEDAVTLAPSSYGLQPYKVLVVTDQAVREKLRAAAYGQSQITDASHLVIFAYKKTLTEKDVERFIEHTGKVRGQEREALAEFADVLNGAVKRATEGGTMESWNSRQAYISLGFLLESAALLGIDATPMEGFDAKQFNEILGLEDFSAVAVCALGYRDSENDWLASLPKVRLPKEELVERI